MGEFTNYVPDSKSLIIMMLYYHCLDSKHKYTIIKKS